MMVCQIGFRRREILVRPCRILVFRAGNWPARDIDDVGELNRICLGLLQDQANQIRALGRRECAPRGLRFLHR